MRRQELRRAWLASRTTLAPRRAKAWAVASPMLSSGGFSASSFCSLILSLSCSVAGTSPLFGATSLLDGRCSSSVLGGLKPRLSPRALPSRIPTRNPRMPPITSPTATPAVPPVIEAVVPADAAACASVLWSRCIFSFPACYPVASQYVTPPDKAFVHHFPQRPEIADILQTLHHVFGAQGRIRCHAGHGGEDPHGASPRAGEAGWSSHLGPPH